MADVFTKERRSEIMSKISGRNTRPEMMVRKILHAMGYRFRLNDKQLPGKPDIVLPRHRKVVFVHGCFWHGHTPCSRGKMPATNADFWITKISRNRERDDVTVKRLQLLGWSCLIVWSCELKNLEILRQKLRRFMQDGTTIEAKRPGGPSSETC